MRFYNQQHDYYCGIDLHARILYVCILDAQAINSSTKRLRPTAMDKAWTGTLKEIDKSINFTVQCLSHQRLHSDLLIPPVIGNLIGIVSLLTKVLIVTTARKQLISVEATPYYHCVSRCVRRSFLCGYDAINEVSYEHRRGWIEKRLLNLAQAFCIDVCSYAIMNNHYHVVLHINPAQAESLSQEDVIDRWLAFHRAPAIIQRKQNGETLSEAAQEQCSELIECWRERLTSISWFMRLLNQFIASEANREDKCTGHFWEGRFKSQALLDEKALAAAMAYVDLNPVWAAIASTPENSEFTSVKTRIESLYRNEETAPKLFPFAGNPRKNMGEGIPFRLMDYLELVDWTGKQVRGDKRGHISQVFPPILERLGFDTKTWLETCTKIERGNMIGTELAIKAALPCLHRKRQSGLRLPTG